MFSDVETVEYDIWKSFRFSTKVESIITQYTVNVIEPYAIISKMKKKFSFSEKIYLNIVFSLETIAILVSR